MYFEFAYTIRKNSDRVFYNASIYAKNNDRLSNGEVNLGKMENPQIREHGLLSKETYLKFLTILR